MESSTAAAPAERSTGSETIADLMARAAERYGDRAMVRLQAPTASGTTSPIARSARSSPRSPAA